MPLRVMPLPGRHNITTVSYTHLRAHETRRHRVCRLLLEQGGPIFTQKTAYAMTSSLVGSEMCIRDRS
ncbi:hypothetical protein ACX3VG_20100 [Escherichia coli]